MSRFIKIIILSCVIYTIPSDISACLMEYPSHNYYMISYVDKNYESNIFADGINAFWKSYTKGTYDEYPQFDQHGLEEFILSQQDYDMHEYVQNLNIYLDICNEIDYWSYPTEEELEERESTLLELKNKSIDYSGSRLRSQYSLLYMRCNMLLEDWGEIKRYWESTANKLPQNVFYSMMENIYAGSLLRSGRFKESTSIYIRQGDIESVRWLLKEYVNVKGIRKIYEQDANSPLLPYLVQDYVNMIQETLDNSQGTTPESLFRRFQTSLECIPFYCLSKEVVESGKSKNPCMWSTASAMLYYLNGDLKTSKLISSESLQLDGDERVKDNCRCVNILINSSDSACDRNWLVNELLWLENKIKTENTHSYCYSNAYERILMKSLVPIYSCPTSQSLGLAVAGLYNELLVSNNEYNSRSPKYNPENGPSTWNDDYDNEYMQEYIYPLSAKSCSNYYKFLTSNHEDKLSSHICSKVYKDSNFFNDLIGTKYLSEGNFYSAIEYLEKVDLSYLSKQNISSYMQKRDFSKECWFVNQRCDENIEGISSFKFSSNPKLEFCRSIISLENKFNKTRKSDDKYDLAYQLACYYYQASHKGDCWWLTSYFKTNNDEYYKHHKNISSTDYIEKAKHYLKYCLSSKSIDMQSKCQYALAYIPIDPWADSESDYTDGKLITTYVNPHPESSQYQYLSMLSSFFDSHKSESPDYISKCDVLKQFRKLKWFSE